jgi:hypothetical protein
MAGTAVSLQIGAGPYNGRYSTTLDGTTTEGDSFSANTECKIGFERANLANKVHTVVVKSLGASAQAPAGSPGNFDFEGMM